MKRGNRKCGSPPQLEYLSSSGLDSLRFKVNQRPVHTAHQLVRLQDYFWGFQSLLEELQGGNDNLASHQELELFDSNLPARTQTGSLSSAGAHTRSCHLWFLVTRRMLVFWGTSGGVHTCPFLAPLYDQPLKGTCSVWSSLLLSRDISTHQVSTEASRRKMCLYTDDVTMWFLSVTLKAWRLSSVSKPGSQSAERCFAAW